MQNIFDGCPVCRIAGRKEFEGVAVSNTRFTFSSFSDVSIIERGKPGHLHVSPAEFVRCRNCGSVFCFTPEELEEFDQEDTI